MGAGKGNGTEVGEWRAGVVVSGPYDGGAESLGRWNVASHEVERHAGRFREAAPCDPASSQRGLADA